MSLQHSLLVCLSPPSFFLFSSTFHHPLHALSALSLEFIAQAGPLLSLAERQEQSLSWGHVVTRSRKMVPIRSDANVVAVHAGCSCNVCGCVLCECVWGLCILYTYLHLYHLCTLLEKSYLGVRSEIDIIDIIDINVHSQTDTHTHTHTHCCLCLCNVFLCV